MKKNKKMSLRLKNTLKLKNKYKLKLNNKHNRKKILNLQNGNRKY